MVMRKMTALLTFVLIICLLPAAAFAKTFKEGDKDWKIMVTQQKLKTLGYATDRTDGKFSKATADSLKNFQKKHKLKANGRLDDKTYKRSHGKPLKGRDYQCQGQGCRENGF